MPLPVEDDEELLVPPLEDPPVLEVVSVLELEDPEDEPDELPLEEPVGAAPVKPRATAASSLGDESPNPQPPSRSCATTAPAHLPLLKPQQPDAQSASLVHTPVMNCVPLPPELELELDDEEAELLESVLDVSLAPVPAAPIPVKPRATAALSLGEESPNPQPPSRS